MSTELQVNGVAREVASSPDTLLVYVLREELGLTGTHVGCDTSVCGACTVLVDGTPRRSCAMLAGQAEGRDVRTVEGLAGDDGELSPVQRAFTELHALQCGFCTSGFLMVATAFVSEVEADENPTEDDVRAALGGNLCRCTGYQNIVDAVVRVARESQR